MYVIFNFSRTESACGKKNIFLYRYILYRANEKLDAKKREAKKIIKMNKNRLQALVLCIFLKFSTFRLKLFFSYLFGKCFFFWYTIRFVFLQFLVFFFFLFACFFLFNLAAFALHEGRQVGIVGNTDRVTCVTHQLLCWPGSAWFYRVYKADCSHPWCSQRYSNNIETFCIQRLYRNFLF